MARCDTLKIIQAAAILLKQHDGRISRLRLLKLLYIADRECLAETLSPVTYDKAVAMDHGPVLSKTYDLLKGTDRESPKWNEFIRHIGPRDMELQNDPGVGQLSRFEVSKLIAVCERFWNNNDWEVAEFTHQYQEWENNRPERGGQRRISFDDRMAALGFGDEEKNKVLSNHREDISIDKLLFSARQR